MFARLGDLAVRDPGLWCDLALGDLSSQTEACLTRSQMVSSISSEYKQSNQAGWLGTSYLLATCTFIPLYGRLSDAMGRRGANQTVVFFAGLGTLCCGLSNSLGMLNVARFLSGIGGGGVFTTATVITSDMFFSMRDRGLAQGIASIFNGAGAGFGGPLGGWISDRFGWRWAFLVQIPFWVTSFILTGYNLRYVTPGRGRSTKDVLKRIDYGGSLTLLLSIGSLLFFPSYKYNDDLPFNSPAVIASVAICIVTFIVFVLFELLIAPEPILAPFLLRKKVPILIGTSDLLATMCNFAIIYFFPMYFETVMLTSASTAGAHLLPNSIAMSTGSLFAGWSLSRTGRYRIIGMIFGICLAIAAVSLFAFPALLTRLNENSGIFAQWLTILLVFQTTLMALLVNVDLSAIAVATGFLQLWRGIGQVCGVAFASAVFQSILDRELTKRITGPDAADMVRRIRHSSRLVATFPPDLQRHAQASYGIAIRWVFALAACSSFSAFRIRLAIPDKSLDDEAPDVPPKPVTSAVSDSCTMADGDDEEAAPASGRPRASPPGGRISRRLSTYESTESGMDLEDETAGSERT
ncbi:major facilitator superfamily domain-containing protein [Hysterangium stoloniferum]|nr:major facilitator superfamily domain-containing protein [Hysterangium stoloniferum]